MSFQFSFLYEAYMVIYRSTAEVAQCSNTHGHPFFFYLFSTDALILVWVINNNNNNKK